MTLFEFLGLSKAPVEPTIPANTNGNQEKVDPIATYSGLKRKRYGGDALGETVAIDVGGADGSEVIRFDAHKRKLRKASKFFASKFGSGAALQVVELPNEEPAIFNQVQHWIYNGTLLEPRDDDSMASQQPVVMEFPSDERAARVKRMKLDNGKATEVDWDDDSLVDDSKAAEQDTDEENIPDYVADVENQHDNLTSDAKNVKRQDNRLDTLTLTKIYVLAETLGMPKLCNQVISQLAQTLDPAEDVPMKELLYAYRRSKSASKVRELLIHFLAETQDAVDLDFLTGYEPQVPKQLLQDLVFALALLRAESRDGVMWQELMVARGELGRYEVAE